MSKLPYSRVVNVSIDRQDNFTARRGFGTLLILTNVAVAGKLDATLRTKVYSTIQEVEADHATSTDFYKAAEVAFSQRPRPLQIKGGYIQFVATGGTPDDADDLKSQLSLIAAYDNDWYWLGIIKALRDLAALDGLIEWVEANTKQGMLDSNDVGHETSSNTTAIAARNKNQFERTAIFYHPDNTEHLGIGTAALLGTFNFDDADSAYTAKFKRIAGVADINKGSAAVQAITGFTPALGQSVDTGHMANTYIDIGGQTFLTEGSTLTPNVFIDEIHASDWIVARTEEATLSIMLNNARIPYTDVGMDMLTAGARQVMGVATRAGLIEPDSYDETGKFVPAVEYIIPRVSTVPVSQRKARIAPAIQVKFRYQGAVHYTTINYTMTF